MDDDLLRQLGALEREDEASRPNAWEGVIAGTRSVDEARALSEGIADADLDRYAALFTPMGDGETEALVDTLQAALAGRLGDAGSDPLDLPGEPAADLDHADLDHADLDRTSQARGRAPGDDRSPPIELAERRTPRAVEHLTEAGSNPDTNTSASTAEPAAPLSLADARRSRRGWMTAAAGLVAVAAALTLWLRPADPSGPAGANRELSPFSLVVRNETIRVNRSAADEPAEARPRYRGDSEIHWLLSPDEALTRADAGTLTVRAWASRDDDIDDDNDARPRSLRLDDALTISDKGVVELRGTFGELFDLPPGRWTIQLAVAVGELPEALDDARRVASERPALLLPPYSLEVID